MKKFTIFSLISVLVLMMVLGCQPKDQSENSLFPPGENQELVLEPGQVIYLKDASTDYSLGEVGSEFYLTEDKLVVKGEEEIETFEISYDKTTITLNEFQEQVQMGEELSDTSSYKSIIRYDLCESTKDLPGYRLYLLDDDTYWMATLYNNNIWRIIEMDGSYWEN